MAGKNSSSLAPTGSTDITFRYAPPKEMTFEEISKKLYESGQAVAASEYGTGFDVLDRNAKGQLVGVPFWILDWRVNEGDFGEFVSATVITKDNRRLVLNDGSTGIAKQLMEISAKGEQRAIYCKKGLRKSEYDYKDKDGTMKPAVTYYLDTSA